MIARIILGILVLLFLILLFIRSPWGQNIIVNKAVAFVSNKTHTKIVLKKLFITFNGNIQLNGLYLEDTKGDTLVYSKSLEANVPLWTMMTGKGVGVDALYWEGLRANIIRKDTIDGYNFQFLIDAFASTDTTSVKTDSTSTPLKIILGNLNFKNLDIVFDDNVIGTNSQFKIGKLQADFDKTDLEQMFFETSKIELTDSNIKFIQKQVPKVADSSASKLPVLVIEKLKMNNVLADYKSFGDNIAAKANIQDFYAEIPSLNLVTNTFKLDDIRLKNSSFVLHTKSNPNLASHNPEETSNAFQWPEQKITVNNINFQNIAFSYFVDDEKANTGSLNPKAMVWTDLNFLANNIILKDKTAKLHIENTSIKENSGLDLKALSLSLSVSDQTLNLKNLKTALNNNNLEANLHLEYSALSSLMKAPETSKIDLNIPNFKIDINDIFLFQPELKKNAILDSLSSKPFTGNIKANGYLSKIRISSIKANWGNSTKFSANGNIQNATNTDSLQLNIPNFYAITKRSDISKFVNEKETGVRLPEDLKLTGEIKGALNNIYTNAVLNTSQGLAKLIGHLKNANDLEFTADVSIENYQLDDLLQNKQLGPLNTTIKAQGKGKNINTLNANLEATISNFKYNNYDVNDLKLIGNIKNGRGIITSNYKDSNLNADLNAKLILDSMAPEAHIKLNIIGANLQTLGIMQRDIKTSMNIQTDFKGNGTNYDITTEINDGVVVYDNKTYLLGRVNAMAHIRKDTTSVSIKNKLINMILQSNAEPQKFSKALRNHIASYFYRDQKISDRLSQPVHLKLRGHINQAPILNDVFLVNAKDLDTINLAIDFNEKARQLKANVEVPHINYSGMVLDSLAFSMDTDNEKFTFDIGFKNILAGPLNIPKTTIVGNQSNNKLDLNISAFRDNTQMMYVDANITGNREKLNLHVIPEKLILNNENWSIPANNELIFTDNKKLAFSNFKINKNEQSIEITDKLSNVSKNHIAITYTNFKISEILDYLNPKTKLATGILQGDFIIESPFQETGVLANLSVNQLKVMEVNLGTLKLDAKSLGGKSYDFNAKLKGGEINLDLKGGYIARQTGANLDLNLDINQFNMKALTGFSQSNISEADGTFSGNFKLTGTTEQPNYEGKLNFNNAYFKLSKFNTGFTLANETLNINNTGVSMNNFTISDVNKNTFALSGKIGTASFINPTFNLKLKANDFQFINATKEDNDFLYGKARFNADASILGDLQIPKVDMNVTVDSETDITYVLPSASVNIEERDGVVLFVNRENPDAILTQTEEKTATIKGFDITTSLKIGKEAAFTLLIDEETGDNFKVSGEGDFNFKMNPNGNMTLAGIYEVETGHYELNLYNLVNRKFNLESGSRVTWSGDPFDAKMDIKALYEVDASASTLMAPIYSNDNVSSNKFRQVLPFYVYLNIDGQLMEPKINFNLDMPEEDQGAIGGQVYGRVQQLNQQEDELNRQVFSLLVLNRFYPDSGSDGSTGGVASIARDNLNDAVSDQLNIFSDKLLGQTGFELDFGLDSYTDYQGNSPEDRTQLDIAAQKKLFNDRLIVRVGSEVDIQGSSSTDEETPLIGNVSIEYLLSENGRYRLKGFRKNEFENVIDGQTIVSGISVIFTQEFNKFRALWEALLTSKTEEEKQEEAKANKKAEESNKIREQKN
ncbi:hypothetical protein APS56_11295 [Pseudalgibacter alginicilyticus]|uniref:Translocation and assembly module TamB C-terminal domain-containing protein n=1 Tax=Pseudalgibacter alginicilyticus TaxID=1736674 RepID=A0A0P0CKT7_9FLAO|nr:hypothetical protein APS56_11295 [Pseudalgibacter alginicilyticus]